MFDAGEGKPLMIPKTSSERGSHFITRWVITGATGGHLFVAELKTFSGKVTYQGWFSRLDVMETSRASLQLLFDGVGPIEAWEGGPVCFVLEEHVHVEPDVR